MPGMEKVCVEKSDFTEISDRTDLLRFGIEDWYGEVNLDMSNLV